MGKPGADTSLLPPVKTPTPTAAPAPFGTSQGYSTFQSNVAKALASGQSYDQAKATAAKMSGGENTRPYELAMNLARGKLSNPNAFASRDTFNATYGYDQKSPEEKAMMDSFWNKSSEGTVDTSPNAVINAMSTPGQNFSQGIIASQLNMMKPNDIVNMVKSGTISESSPAFIDFQTKNPQAAAQYQQIKANQAKVDQINSTAITAHVLGAPDKLDPNKSLASQVKKPTEVSHPAVDALTGIQSRIQQTTKEFDNIHPNYGNLYQKSLTDNGFYDLNSQAMDAGKRVMGLQRDIQNVTLNLKANALTAGSTNTYIQEKAYQTTQQLSSQLFDASSSLTALNASMTRIQDTAKYQVQTQQMEDSMNKDLITSKLGALQSEAGIATTQAGYAQQEKMARLSSSLANPTLQSEDPQVRQNALREAAK